MKRPAPEKAVDRAKTSIRMPRQIWKAAHIRALDEGRDLQDVIVSALELYLKTPVKSRAGEQN
jgi:hypothetical protein